MVKPLLLGALGLAFSGFSTAVALPQTDATAGSAAKPPKCKGLTKRQEWWVPQRDQPSTGTVN
jgi:hypothetical protein